MRNYQRDLDSSLEPGGSPTDLKQKGKGITKEKGKGIMNTVPIIQSWESIIPILVEAAANGTTVKGRRAAMSELKRLARMVDNIISAEKEEIVNKQIRDTVAFGV